MYQVRNNRRLTRELIAHGCARTAIIVDLRDAAALINMHGDRARLWVTAETPSSAPISVLCPRAMSLSAAADRNVRHLADRAGYCGSRPQYAALALDPEKQPVGLEPGMTVWIENLRK